MAAVALLQHAPVLHHHHAFGVARHHGQVVADHQHGRAMLAGQRHHQFQHIALHHRVQRRRRLIGDQQRGLQQHHRGQHHALAHTAGEFMRPGLDRRLGIAYAHARQHVQHPFAPLGRAQAVAMQLQTFLQLATDGHGWVERSHRLLEHHADAPRAARAVRRRCARHVHALEQDRTARHHQRRGRQPHDGARRLGLAAAGLADDADHFSRRDREGHVADDFAPAGAHGQGQPRHRYQCAHCTPLMRGSKRSRTASPAG